jgi:hypothetical protein
MSAKLPSLCKTTQAQLLAEKRADGSPRQRGDLCPYCPVLVAGHENPQGGASSAAAAGRRERPSGSDSEERYAKKAKRDSGGSVRSHSSDSDDGAAAVSIRINDGKGHCNGTLINFRSKLFVWTTAHALVDTTSPELKLFDKIELLLPTSLRTGDFPTIGLGARAPLLQPL